MRSFGTRAGYVVRLDPGEDVLATLTAFVRQAKLQGGAITGIGVVRTATLGYFDLHVRQYVRREIPQEMELVSFMGNVSWVDEDPMIHAHVTLVGPDFAAVGGHLLGAEVAVTGEFFIVATDVAVQRALDERTGLRLMDREVAR